MAKLRNFGTLTHLLLSLQILQVLIIRTGKNMQSQCDKKFSLLKTEHGAWQLMQDEGVYPLHCQANLVIVIYFLFFYGTSWIQQLTAWPDTSVHLLLLTSSMHRHLQLQQKEVCTVGPFSLGLSTQKTCFTLLHKNSTSNLTLERNRFFRFQLQNYLWRQRRRRQRRRP